GARGRDAERPDPARPPPERARARDPARRRARGLRARRLDRERRRHFVLLDGRAERLDDARIELRSCAAAKLGERPAQVLGGAVGAAADDGVERVADGDDARAERDFLAGEPVRVTRPVEALVARTDERPEVGESRSGGEDPLADDRMPAHEVPLLVSQRPGLLDDSLRDRDLADVVQLRSPANARGLLLVQAETPCDRLGKLADAVEMVAEVGMALGEGLNEDALALDARRRPAVVLLGVHALV